MSLQEKTPLVPTPRVHIKPEPWKLRDKSSALFLCPVFIVFCGAWISRAAQGKVPLADGLIDSSSAFKSSSAQGMANIHLSNVYGEGYQNRGPSSLQWYAWDYLAEPYRVTTMHAVTTEPMTSVMWRIKIKDKTDLIFSGNGSIVEYTFDHPGQAYGVELAVSDVVGVWATTTVDVVCKYVRREIRTLNDEDREAYFRTVRLMYTLTKAEGKSVYGSKFVNAKHLTRKHLGGITVEGCTPWHNNFVFMAAHSAFTLEFEQSLQAIVPRLAAPYWDYTLDDALYGKAWPSKSPMFQSDSFGEYPTNDTEFVVVKSEHLGNIPLPRCELMNGTEILDCLEHNAYGYMLDTIAYTSADAVPRAASICGLPTEAPLPGCKALRYSLHSHNATDFRYRVENYLHGNIHTLTGGLWNCLRPAPVKVFPRITPLVSEILSIFNIIARDTISYNNRHMGNYCGKIQCPMDCTAESQSHFGRDCTCTMPTVLDQMKNGTSLSYPYATQVWYEWGLIGILQDIYGGAVSLEYEDATSMNLLFPELNQIEREEFVIWVAELLAYMPTFGPMTSTGASTADPIFWPVHGMWERLWHRKRLEAERSGDAQKQADWTVWNDDAGHAATCIWSRYENSSVPWINFTASSPDRFYKNSELMELFSPSNLELPFVFENFDVSHCDSTLAADPLNGTSSLYEDFESAEEYDETKSHQLFKGQLGVRLWEKLYSKGKSEGKGIDSSMQGEEYVRWLHEGP